ncbi:MAG: MarR family winged helix-turn-helix transcriptional regulator [Actinomycetota bacterium]
MVTDDAWLDDEQLRAWVTLMAFLEVMPSSVEGQLKRDVGVNLFEYSVLAMLSEQVDRTLVMSDLAQVAFGSLSRLSHAVTRLERRGWVERRAGSGGRRHNTVWLTDAGLEAITDAAPLHVAHVRELLVAPLSAAELATLTSLLRRLIGAANPALDERLDHLVPTIIERNLGST